MIATVSPASFNDQESISTLRFADSAKKIKNKAKVNRDKRNDEIQALREENKALREKIVLLEEKIEHLLDNVLSVEHELASSLPISEVKSIKDKTEKLEGTTIRQASTIKHHEAAAATLSKRLKSVEKELLDLKSESLSTVETADENEEIARLQRLLEEESALRQESEQEKLKLQTELIQEIKLKEELRLVADGGRNGCCVIN